MTEQEQELRRIFSVNIKKYRNRRNWSQTKLAEEIELSTNFISDMETGKGWVSPLTLVKLAQALDVEVYELFEPEQTQSNEQRDLIIKLTTDLSNMLNQSVEYVKTQYLINK